MRTCQVKLTVKQGNSPPMEKAQHDPLTLMAHRRPCEAATSAHQPRSHQPRINTGPSPPLSPHPPRAQTQHTHGVRAEDRRLYPHLRGRIRRGFGVDGLVLRRSAEAPRGGNHREGLVPGRGGARGRRQGGGARGRGRGQAQYLGHVRRAQGAGEGEPLIPHPVYPFSARCARARFVRYSHS
jgi:hypothetical protein